MAATRLGAGSGSGKCNHFAIRRVMSLGGSSIWAGSVDDVEDMLESGSVPIDLIIDASGQTLGMWKAPKPPVTLSKSAADMFGDTLNPRDISLPPIVSLDWPDFGVPHAVLDRDWFHGFARQLAERELSVAICCTGGHGRTGTLLSILAPLADDKLGTQRFSKKARRAATKAWKERKERPVQAIRAVYCDKAVETETQLYLVADVTETDVTAEPAHDWSSRLPLTQPKGTGSLAGDPDWIEDPNHPGVFRRKTDMLEARGL